MPGITPDARPSRSSARPRRTVTAPTLLVAAGLIGVLGGTVNCALLVHRIHAGPGPGDALELSALVASALGLVVAVVLAVLLVICAVLLGREHTWAIGLLLVCGSLCLLFDLVSLGGSWPTLVAGVAQALAVVFAVLITLRSGGHARR
jgi:hypothetical protein